MIPKPIEAIGKADIDALLTNAVSEGRTLDYKLTLPGGSDEAKKEFLADTSSFANAAGGDMVFGVEEAGGVPVAIQGIPGITDLDAEILRLDEVLRNGIEPRMPGVRLHPVLGFPAGPVLVLRVPRSFASPHMVAFKKSSRFYARNNAGKFQLDVGELRAAFAASGDLSERLRRFRMDRLSQVIAGETPVPMGAGSKLVLHLLPFSSFMLASHIDNDLQEILRTKLRPITVTGWSHRHNIDGFVTFSGSPRSGGPVNSYCQFFRSGAVEAVYSDLVWEKDGVRTIGCVKYEKDLMEATHSYLAGLREIGVPLPILVMLSMTGMRGVEMFVGSRYYDLDSGPIDRDVLLLPDVVVEQVAPDVPRLLRPIFDAVWNAAGYERSFNYDEHGKWRAIGS